MKKICITACLFTIGLSGCGPSAPEAGGPRVDGTVVIEMNPSGRAPLAGVARFTTLEPTRATITVSDDDGNAFDVESGDTLETVHEIMLLGFRPNRPHRLSVSLEAGDGRTANVANLSVVSPRLPIDTPPVELTVSEPGNMEPGLTMIPLFRWIDQQIVQTHGQILVVNADGEIVWQYIAPHGIVEVKQLENGHLVYLRFGFQIVEIDMLGNVVAQWHASRAQIADSADSIPIATDTLHHDVLVMPSGNFLALSTELREVPDWYTSEEDPDAERRTQNIIADVLVEIRRDGTVVNEWKFLDLIDPYRIGYGSTNTAFYEGVYDEPAPDWTHNNGIHYDEASHSALVSSNHLSAVMNLDLETGELEWILGDPGNWREPWSDLLLEPEGDLLWSYHHHAPKWTSEGTLMLFDNGAGRALPFDAQLTAAESFSRAVEYEIDAANGTVRQVWSYGGPDEDRFLSAYISDADLLPATGNVLVTKGGRVRAKDGGVLMFPEEGHNWITVTEVTHTMPANKVWEFVIDDRRWGMASFRTERIPSLYW